MEVLCKDLFASVSKIIHLVRNDRCRAVYSVQIVSLKFRQGILSFLSSYGMDGTSFTEPPPM